MEILRQLNLPELLEKKSFFLFGPRATGKSYCVGRQLGDALVIDLLKSELLLRLSRAPGQLESLIQARLDRSSPDAKAPYIVIDEIQKIPDLLNEVHRLIEQRGFRFLLTGSSARKLKRGQANLLAGRAWKAELFPFCTAELPDFNLDRFLRFGGLPPVYLSDAPEEELDAYVHTYLYEEIQAEGLIRKLAPFSRFLEVAALSSGRMINYARLAQDAQTPASTIREYFRLLEDTLLGFTVPAWTRSRKRRATTTARFYLFDTGVAHALAGTRRIDRNSDLYGRSFEQFIAMEIRAALSYQRARQSLSYWRSKHGHEVDFIIGDEVAIEVKASRRVSPRDASGLHALNEEKIVRDLYLVSHDEVELRSGPVSYLHWSSFLKRLHDGSLLVP